MILKPLDRNIRRAAKMLLAGDPVAFPTETVYGLGADAFDPVAVEKIFRLKHRPHYDPLIVHVDGIEMMETVVRLDDRLRGLTGPLIRRFWPGPLTMVLPKSDLVPDLVTAGSRTVAVRMPAHPVALKLIRTAGVPVAAPSANRFGRLSPVTARHVVDQLGDGIVVLDGGRARVGVESTILDLTGREPVILRPGGVAPERIGSVLKRTVKVSARPGTGPKVPGRFKSHYAPKTRLTLFPATGFNRMRRMSGVDGSACFLYWKRPKNPDSRTRWLTVSGDPAEGCRNLYAVLHGIDGMGYDRIIAEQPPNRGLAVTVLDRLARAANRG